MQYHVLTTERCNLQCTYCGGTRELPGVPLDLSYDISELSRFISRDLEAVVGFYGGEPLLALERIYDIMDHVPAVAFTLQTNGTLLRELRTEYLLRFHSILVSLDGPREVTDASRGEGTYDLVMSNVRDMKERGFKGDLIARMAFSDQGDIHRDVTHLLQTFDHVHWQLDVFWTDLEARGDVKGWLDRYDRGMDRLVNDFASAMERGKVLGITPFIPLMRTLLSGEPHHLWCGSGTDSFAIMTSGEIEACPIAPELRTFHLGHISSCSPEDVKGAMSVGPPCTDCDILWVCGGRCLFSNRTMGWGREWFDRVCLTTRRMIEALERHAPRARELIRDGTLPIDAFAHPDINNGCEIIP